MTHPHLICCEAITRVFLDAGYKLWPRFRKEDTKKVLYKLKFSLYFPTHLQTWSTSSLAAGKTYRGSSSRGSASLMQELRVSVLQSSRPPLWLLTRPGKENCITLKHFKSPFMDPVLAIPQLKSLSLCLCSRLISCNIINNKKQRHAESSNFIERFCFLSISFSRKFRSYT